MQLIEWVTGASQSHSQCKVCFLSVITKLWMNNRLCFHGHAVPAPVEIVTATINVSLHMNYYITAKWKVNTLVFKYNLALIWKRCYSILILVTLQSCLLSNVPPVSHYIVYHNVTIDGDQGITVYDTSVTINVTDDQFEANAVYCIQVAAVNIIGQGPVRKTTLSKCSFEFPR